MNTLERLQAVQLNADTTLGDLLSLNFLFGLAGQIVLAALILLAGFLIAGFVKRKIRRVTALSPHLDQTTGGFLANLARYAILALTIIFVLQQFGLQTTSLVALLGAAGLAIGLALQGVLSCVAAGVMIVLFRPVKIGDFVEVNGQVGTVKDITIFTTELASSDNAKIVIPNSEVWGNTIINYSAYDTRCAVLTFGVGYDADLRKAEQIIRDVVLSDPRALTDPEPFIQVNNLGEFSVDFLVRVWTPATGYFKFQADMKRLVKEALDAGGVDIPYPTQRVIRDA